ILGAIRWFLIFLVSAVAAALTNLNAVAQCPTNVPHITGTWTVLPYQMPINPISTNLLRNGKVLIVAGDEQDGYNNLAGADSYRACRWSHYGHVRDHPNGSYKSNDRNLRSPTSWSWLESTHQRSVHPSAFPKA